MPLLTTNSASSCSYTSTATMRLVLYVVDSIVLIRQQALRHFQLALKTNPASDEAENNIGYLLHTHYSDLDAALLHLTKAASNQANFVARNNLGLLYTELKQPTEARACFEEAIRIAPTYTFAIYNLATLLQDEFRQYDESLRLYAQVLQINPIDADAEANMGVLYQYHLDNPADARKHYERAIDIKVRSSFYALIGIILYDVHFSSS